MNKAEVQEIYDKVNTTRSIFAVDVLGLKFCLFNDLFGNVSVEDISDTDVYIQVKSKLQELCEYALNVKPEPVAKDWNGDDIYIGGTVWFGDEKYLVHAYMPKSATSSERILVTSCDVWETPMWLFLGGNGVTVKKPNGQDDALDDVASAIRALQDTLQKDVLSKLETALESLREAQKG